MKFCRLELRARSPRGPTLLLKHVENPCRRSKLGRGPVLLRGDTDHRGPEPQPQMQRTIRGVVTYVTRPLPPGRPSDSRSPVHVSGAGIGRRRESHPEDMRPTHAPRMLGVRVVYGYVALRMRGLRCVCFVDRPRAHTDHRVETDRLPHPFTWRRCSAAALGAPGGSARRSTRSAMDHAPSTRCSRAVRRGSHAGDQGVTRR